MHSSFSQRLFDLALEIPEGRVTTYGAIARAAGGGGQAARSVSHILRKSPNPGVIPWHRIVYAGGLVWMAPEYEEERNMHYEREGIEVNEKGYIINFEDIFYDFS